MGVRGWIDGDESGREMLSRLLTDRPYMHLPPPFHKLPVRVGNVVELVGPSPSAKTNILMHSAIDCILPQSWNGVHYGGFGNLVLFIDLDCRFDVLRLSQMLKDRILLSNNTIRSRQANSHAKRGWEHFTDSVIKTISQKKEGVVFLLWGNSAQEKSRLIDETKHHILKAAHPSGLSANRGFFGCRHFSRANKLLEQQGTPPIDWQL